MNRGHDAEGCDAGEIMLGAMQMPYEYGPREGAVGVGSMGRSHDVPRGYGAKGAACSLSF
ncbi:hypothetical protein ACMX0V_01180 [Bartonella bacilliformis]|uniref:hypothetical protein n=1 Tax=Bartonella bacilliformis TaxID=774 RepID=UPI0005A492AD